MLYGRDENYNDVAINNGEFQMYDLGYVELSLQPGDNVYLDGVEVLHPSVLYSTAYAVFDGVMIGRNFAPGYRMNIRLNFGGSDGPTGGMALYYDTQRSMPINTRTMATISKTGRMVRIRMSASQIWTYDAVRVNSLGMIQRSTDYADPEEYGDNIPTVYINGRLKLIIGGGDGGDLL